MISLARNIIGRGLQFIRRVMGRGKRKYGWFGNYPNWKEAASYCAGYDQDNILEKVKAAVHLVKEGNAAFERDSVVFMEYDCDESIKTILMELAASVKGKFHIADFGGSLGSLYFQYKRFLTEGTYTWNVIEQKHFVECGRREFEDAHLHFYFSLDELEQIAKPDLLILSSVLCYLEDPYAWIRDFCNRGIPAILVDRTAFIEDAAERITIQIVPPDIYEASYPAWFLNENKMLEAFGEKYELLRTIDDTVDGEDIVDGKRCYRKGFYFRLKE